MEFLKTRQMGRGFVDHHVSNNECTCLRPKTNVLCNNCGNVMYGRVENMCPIHSAVAYLCDIKSCVKCKANKSLLREFDAEYDDREWKFNNKTLSSPRT